MADLVAKIKEYREYKRMAEELLALADGIADELKAHITEAGENKVIIGEYKLSYTDVTRTDINRKKLKEEEAEIFEKYSYSTTYKRFLVS
jgi:predicted phage-related endonuclease